MGAGQLGQQVRIAQTVEDDQRAAGPQQVVEPAADLQHLEDDLLRLAVTDQLRRLAGIGQPVADLSGAGGVGRLADAQRELPVDRLAVNVEPLPRTQGDGVTDEDLRVAILVLLPHGSSWCGRLQRAHGGIFPALPAGSNARFRPKILPVLRRADLPRPGPALRAEYVGRPRHFLETSPGRKEPAESSSGPSVHRRERRLQ